MLMASSFPRFDDNLPLESVIESILFVADGPVPVARIAAVLNTGSSQVEKAVTDLQESLRERGLRVQRSKGNVQLTTAPETAAVLETFLGLESFQRLSPAALETLAVVAYQQPVTRPQVDAIRGVNSDSVMKGLISKGLLGELGRFEGVGRPILYGTTTEFLQHFGLNSLKELPPLNIEQDTSRTDLPTAAPGGINSLFIVDDEGNSPPSPQ